MKFTKADESMGKIRQSLIACEEACRSCAEACLSEKDIDMLRTCIRIDLECAEICALTARLVLTGSRFSGSAFGLCAGACEACSQECAEHSLMDHCRKCSEACRICAEACRAMAEVTAST